MTNSKIATLAIVLLILILAIAWSFSGDDEPVVITNFDECVAGGNAVMESYPRQCRAGEQTFVEDIGNELEKTDLIRINSPRPNQEITSPLVIEGEARGFWFFEGDFPVKLLNESGEVIVEHYATAEGEWMTEDFVLFKATISFDAEPQKGTLILERDNPSGLSENADELRVPIKIIQTTDKSAVLIGKVIVGPICPVEREGVPCIIPPEVYTSREIIVYSEGGQEEVARTNFNSDGTYAFTLERGAYVVDIAKAGIDSSSELPKEIIIESGESFELNFSIDTGIR